MFIKNAHRTRRHFANRPFLRRFNASAKGAVICAGDGQIRQVDTRRAGQYLGAVLSSFDLRARKRSFNAPPHSSRLETSLPLFDGLTERYVEALAARLEQACLLQHGTPVNRLIESLVTTYWNAKMERDSGGLHCGRQVHFGSRRSTPKLGRVPACCGSESTLSTLSSPWTVRKAVTPSA